jgi:hypothetical protein
VAEGQDDREVALVSVLLGGADEPVELALGQRLRGARRTRDALDPLGRQFADASGGLGPGEERVPPSFPPNCTLTYP